MVRFISLVYFAVDEDDDDDDDAVATYSKTTYLRSIEFLLK